METTTQWVNIISSALVALLLIVHIFWIWPRLRDINNILKSLRSIGEIYRDFMENYKTWKEELQQQNEGLREKYQNLESHFNNVRELVGDVPPEEMGNELRKKFETILKLFESTNKLITRQKNRIEQLEDLMPKRRNIANEWIS